MVLPNPSALLTDAPMVRDALDRAEWSDQALEALLGSGARGHLERDELAPLLRRTSGGSPLETLARVFVIGVPLPATAAAAAGVPASWLRPDGSASVRLQAVRHDGVEVTVPHDAGRAAARLAPEAVLGVGAASLTLAAATPRRRVGRVLDVGCGSGIQALLAATHAEQVVATDLNARAVGFARLGAVLAGVRLDVRAGPLLQPVEDETFDLVVSNPPFVIGPAARYTYRDAGLPGDEVCRRLVRDLPGVLAPGGSAVLLVNWLHRAGEDGDERIRSWVDGTGCDAWVVQRELAAPEEYVTAWLRDSDEGARFGPLYDEWMDELERQRVEAVAFGVLALQRGSAATARVTLSEVSQPVAPTWGEEVTAHFARAGGVDADLLDVSWQLRADVRLHEVRRPSEDGWRPESRRLQQASGLRWSGGLDDFGAALLAGCTGVVPLRLLLAVTAAAFGLAEAEAVEQAVPVVRRLVDQGFLLPAGAA